MTAKISCLASAVDHWANVSPDNIALQDENHVISYKELKGLSEDIAAALIGSGLKKGDRIAYYGKNSALYFVLFVAATRSGLVIAPVSWRLTAPEITYILNDTKSKLLLFDNDLESIVNKVSANLSDLKTIVSMSELEGQVSFKQWLDNAPKADCPKHDCNDAVLQLYTSGTTGLPKGAVLNSWGMFSVRNEPEVETVGWANMESDDCMLIIMPVAHIAGSGSVAVAFFNGAKALTHNEFNPERALRAIDKEVSHLFLVPTAIQMMINHPVAKDIDFSGFKYLWYGAAPIPLDLLRQAMDIMKSTQFAQQYGMTETTGTFCALPPEDHDPNGNERMRSAGKALPSVEIKIVDASGNELPRREIGEIVTRSSLNMIEYWNNQEKTNETIDKDGWLYTGDAAYMDEDGYVFIQDRIKDMIISGGENVYPAEVENIVFSHPDVMEVAVIGVPDEKWGEAVKAIIVLNTGKELDEAAIISWLRERMAPYKAPKTITVIDQMPRNASGKILRRELRAPYWKGLDKKL